jgi:hypothetical protein
LSCFCGDEPVVLRPQPGDDEAIARSELGGRVVAKKKVAKKKVAKKPAKKVAKKAPKKKVAKKKKK